MNEAVVNLLGVDKNIATPKAMLYRSLHFMRERMGKYQEETNMLFNLEATPAEARPIVLPEKTRKIPEIICAKRPTAPNTDPYYQFFASAGRLYR